MEIQNKTGLLIIIGGHEDKTNDKRILKRVAKAAGDGPLVVATVASSCAEEYWRDYQKVFAELGVRDCRHLRVESRADAMKEENIRMVQEAKLVFFTGGDQLKITSELGGTPVDDALQELYRRGGAIAGTSAGASVLSETMLVSGNSKASPRIGTVAEMSPGLGLVSDITIDQHFAERGRMGRLLGVVARNPKNLGVGIDENTAILMDDAHAFEVIGEGGVYVVDARDSTYTNSSKNLPEQTLSVFGVRVHLMGEGDWFDVRSRKPIPHEEMSGKNVA